MIIRYIRKPVKVQEIYEEAGHDGKFNQLFLKKKKICKGKPYGVVVGYRENGQIKIGYSLVNPADVFSKYIGKQIALARASKHSEKIISAAQEGKVPAYYNIKDINGEVVQLMKCNSQTRRISNVILKVLEELGEKC